MTVDNFKHLLFNALMIVNVGDIVEVDRHGRADVLRVDYDNERSLVDTGKAVFWINNCYLTKVKEFYEVFNHVSTSVLCK